MIANESDFRAATGIGDRIFAKIKEFANTGHIKELDTLEQHPRIRAYRVLGAIMGVGPVTIDKWFAAGIHTIADLRKAHASKRITLTATQQLGIEHYTDLSTRIPREEMEMIGKQICDCVGAIIHTDTDAPAHKTMCEIMGSYRRGARDSGDVDLIVRIPTNKSADIHQRIAHELRKSVEFVAIVIAGPSRLTFLWRIAPPAQADTTNKVRQVDILLCPRGTYFAALLYFTGSAVFNEAMRGLAKARGFRLNQNGLYRNGRFIAVSSEEEIFRVIGLNYVPPHDRNCISVEACAKLLSQKLPGYIHSSAG
jgi:DNA polymerase/3'-5' exonuclease PolX